jgi:hypothetical protein
MYVMYVDDSGSPNAKDDTKFYVITGAIVHETDLNQIEGMIQHYKKENFNLPEYLDAEIHVHDIYKGQREFRTLTKEKKYALLDSLYDTIRLLPVTLISVGINKETMNSTMPNWSIFTAAWTFLCERFDMFIDDNGNNVNKGIIIVDKSSKIPEREITNVVSRLRRFGSNFQAIDTLAEEPIFIDSHLREGIQVADACAYATLKHLNGHEKFEKYWEVVRDKLRASPGGNVNGYGLKVFP